MRKKFLAIVLIITLLLITMTSIVSASSLTVGIKASQLDVKPGDEVTITISVSNIDKGQKDGVNGIKATLGYNSNVLTYVSNTALNGWSMQDFNQENSTFAVTKGSGYVNENQDVVSFTFKVKENVSVSSTDVTLTGIETSFGLSLDITSAETVTASNTSATINITSVASTYNTPNQTPTITSNVINTNSSNDKSLPQTGVSDIILPAIVVLGVISIISYIRYKNYKNI